MTTTDKYDDSSPRHSWPYLKYMFKVFELKKESNRIKCLQLLLHANFSTAYENSPSNQRKACQDVQTFISKHFKLSCLLVVVAVFMLLLVKIPFMDFYGFAHQDVVLASENAEFQCY